MKQLMPLALSLLLYAGCRHEEPNVITRSLAELKPLPESNLRYPEAEVIGQLGYDNHRDIWI